MVDPAGGSWYVESRTDELAKLAWAEFQAIEQAGGIVAVLRDGSLAKKIADAYAQREGALAKRRDPVTGVSEFPNIQETPLQLEQPDLLAAYRAATDRLKVARGADGGAMAKALDALKSAKPADSRRPRLPRRRPAPPSARSPRR